MINLRDKVKDTISGYTGIVIGVTQWLYGCRRLTVQAQGLHDGKPIETQCIDEQQLEVIDAYEADADTEVWEESQAPTQGIAAAVGGPIPSPQRRADVRR